MPPTHDKKTDSPPAAPPAKPSSASSTAAVTSSPVKDNKSISSTDSVNNKSSSSVLSKAMSYEKLKNDKNSSESQVESKPKGENKIKKLQDKVGGSLNEVLKSSKLPESQIKSKPGSASSRSSLGSVLSENEKHSQDTNRRTSAPAESQLLDDVAPAPQKLVHPTSGRVRAPKRRPPSQHFLKDNVRSL